MTPILNLLCTNPPLLNSAGSPLSLKGIFVKLWRCHKLRHYQSVLNQGYPNLEYFVQDSGSQDGTVEILKRYSERLSGWESLLDDGWSQAINLGFAKTHGEIMTWLNSDALLLPGTLAYVADYFARHPKVDVVYGNRIIIDEQGMEIGRWILPRHNDAVLTWADFLPQETLFWRRSLWEKSGGQIDESFCNGLGAFTKVP